ncbi:glutamate ABC transporter substrate-binding protein [Tomitella biformata]|uniref:glutamate ABC transporter substrate-binding protein n=1 Tax=Tomitella biformata TaxID=630403 RepID=UPI00046507A4|nr:glutamate ABC transporter substrate-binding protein [Tomitella biformata]
MRRPLLTSVGVLASLVLLAGCGTSDYAAPIVAESVGPPLPSGAVLLPSTGTPAPVAVNCADAGSLRPDPAVQADRVRTSSGSVERIRERGRVIVGLDQGSNLFSFRDPLSGDLLGFDVDVAHEVARDLFGNPDRVEFRFLSSAEREQALQDSTVDMVIKTMTITCKRAETVSFSTVYYLAHQRILVTADSKVEDASGLAGSRVCVVAGTTSIGALKQAQPAVSIMTVPSWGDCLVALQQRQVDAVSTDDTILAGMVAQDPNLKIVGPPIEAEPYGIGMHKGDDDLVRFVNGTLERIRQDGRWNQFYDRWLKVLGPSPGPPPAVYSD